MFVVDLKTEEIGVREAVRLKIPIIGLVDTNCDPDPVNFVIPGNDDAIRSCKVIIEAIGDVAADRAPRSSAPRRRRRAQEREEQERREAEEQARREAEEQERREAEERARREAEEAGFPPDEPAPRPDQPAARRAARAPAPSTRTRTAHDEHRPSPHRTSRRSASAPARG